MGLGDLSSTIGTPRSMPADLYFSGLHATAVVRGMQATNVAFGAQFDADPVVTFDLLVSVPGHDPFPLRTNQAVPQLLVGAIVPGATVHVRVDPTQLGRLAIDFNQLMPGAGLYPSGPVTGDQVRAFGISGTGVIVRVFRTWHAFFVPKGDPLRGLVMNVTWPDQRSCVSRSGQRIPRDKLSLVVSGATFPVKGDPDVPDLAVIDWPAVR